MRGDDDVAGAVAGDGAGALSRVAVTEHHKCSDFLCERACVVIFPTRGASWCPRKIRKMKVF